MNLIRNILRKYWPCFLMAIVVGFTISLPSIWIRLDIGEKFKGIHISEIDSDIFYTQRIKRAYDGNYKLNVSNVEESKNGPYIQTPGGEIFVAALSKIFGLRPERMVEIGNFIFPCLLAIILYALFFSITGSKMVSLLVPVIILLDSNLIFNKSDIFNIFFDHDKVGENPYNRPIHPQISSIFFYLWLFFIYHYYKNKKSYTIIIAGILLGAFFYIYPFSWILALAILSFLIFLSFIQKDYVLMRSFFIILSIGLFLSVGYWMNFYQFHAHPLYEIMKKRFIMYPDRTFMWSDLLFLDLLMVFFLFFKTREKEKFYFFLAIIASLILVINQHVITGVRLFPGHWHWYYAVPFSAFIFIYTAYEFIKSRKVLLVLFFSFVLFAALFNGYVVQRTYYGKNKESYTNYQRYMGVFDWFNKNSLRGDVVLGDFDFTERLLFYTSNDRYIFTTGDSFYLISDERLMHSFFVQLYFDGARADTIDEYINQKTPQFITLLNGYYLRYTKKCSECFLPEEIDRVKRGYLEFLQNDFEKELKKYKVDYAVEDTKKDAAYRFGKYNFMKKIITINDLNIYKVM